LPKREEASVIFIYSLTHLAVKDKVRFYYALKGRDGKSGIIKQYNIEQLAKGVLIIDKKTRTTTGRLSQILEMRIP